MPREIVGKGLRFSLRRAPCAHICRYCLISEITQAQRATVFPVRAARSSTEDERDNLPERINELRPARFDNWLSEREWIPVMMETASQPRRLLLKLDVDSTNIDYLENASCEEIFTTRQREYQDSTGEFPHSTSCAHDMAIQPTAKST
jgi:hypothetical protein